MRARLLVAVAVLACGREPARPAERADALLRHERVALDGDPAVGTVVLVREIHGCAPELLPQLGDERQQHMLVEAVVRYQMELLRELDRRDARHVFADGVGASWVADFLTPSDPRLEQTRAEFGRVPDDAARMTPWQSSVLFQIGAAYAHAARHSEVVVHETEDDGVSSLAWAANTVGHPELNGHMDELIEAREAAIAARVLAFLRERPGSVAPDTVREFIDQMDKIDSRDGIDVLLHSAGGDPLTAWKLMSVLREQFKSVAVLVPSTAFSAATLFALGADEIHMHPHASLAPIDPQMTVRTGDGKVRHFAYEDVGAFLKFLSSDVGLCDQPHFAALAEKLLSTVDPLIVGAARRASDLSGEVGARLLMMHMADGTQANEIARNLNKSFFAHGDAVSRSRAKELRLQVADTPKDLEVLMWRAYLGLEAYMVLREPFPPHIELLRHATAAAQMLVFRCATAARAHRRACARRCTRHLDEGAGRRPAMASRREPRPYSPASAAR